MAEKLSGVETVVEVTGTVLGLVGAGGDVVVAAP